MALAEPFLEQTREEKKVTESRIRVDLRDGSSSMEQLFPRTSKIKAQVAAESHLEFLKMRESKNDRVSFWLFASFPHLVEDFIIDDELYYQQVEDAPWLIWGGDIEDWFKKNPNWHIPKERYGIVKGDGGGTDIVLALQAIIKYFDQDEKMLKGPSANTRKTKRSILVITDADVNAFPKNELEGLRKRNIRPYVIWIKSSAGSSPPEFAQRIREYGGEYFDVADENSLKRAYESINKIESTEIEITRKSFKLPLFQNFILMAIVVRVIAVLTTLLFEPFGIYP